MDPKDYHHRFDLQLEKKVSETDRDKLIVETFQQLKTAEGKNPSISKVVNAVKQHSIGRKTVERILKGQKLVQEQIKSKHLNKDTKNKIKNEFHRINPAYGEVKATYRQLADRYNVSVGQVVDLLKDRTYRSGKKVKLDETLDKIQTLHESLRDDPKQIVKIMVETGLSESSVIQYLKKLEAQPKKNS